MSSPCWLTGVKLLDKPLYHGKVSFMFCKLLCVTLLRLKYPSTFLLAMESVVSGLFDIRLTLDICFFFISRGSCTECCHICLGLCINRESLASGFAPELALCSFLYPSDIKSFKVTVLVAKPGNWFPLVKCVKNPLRKNDISEENAASIVKMSLFHRCFHTFC